MRIRYVVSSMVFWLRENNLSLEQECEFLRLQGFGIELWPHIKGYQDCRYSRGNWSRLSAATSGMVVSIRSRDDCPNLEQWEEQLECAKLLDANIVTDLQSMGVPDGSEINGCDFAAEVVQMAQEKGITLCLETGPLQKVQHLGKKFDSLRYCLDTGYANMDRKFGFKKYVEELAERVTHLHLTDNYGLLDDHESPGLKGGIERKNWDCLLSTLQKYDNDVIGAFEMCPSMPAVMIRQASEFIFSQLKWPNAPQQKHDYINVTYNPI